jgi:virginiamycin B lyase
MSKPIIGILAAALLAAPLAWHGARATETVEIQEWDVPYEDSRPRDPYVESAGSVWFVGQAGHYLSRFDVETEQFERVDLEGGTGPHNLIVDGDGVVWFAGNRKGYIGRYDPASDTIEKIMMPDPAARDPHTLVFAPDGDIWFTVQGGNFVGRLAVADRKVDLIPVPTGGARPYGIVVSPEGVPWIALFGTNKLASVDPDTLALTEHVLPRDGARPRRLGLTGDGRVWYVDYAEGMLGVFDPGKESFTEWGLPSGEDASPYGMAIDSKDRIWLVETGVFPNRFVGFDPATESFFSGTDLPSGGSTVRHMNYHAATGTVWFGADTNTIGRAVVE